VELRPNIVIILAGDLGYGDLKYLGGELRKIAMPNVDRLASQGTRLDEPSETNTPFSFA
jgi:arylsulfatase A-like enzyme